MRFSRVVLSVSLITTLALATTRPSVAYMHARRGPTSPGLFKKRSAAKPFSHAPAKPLGPRAIDSSRAVQIQSALIKAGYLSGTPSGHWDAESEAAMQKLQGNKGWQTKLTPDSRALILLGLGPKQDQPRDPEGTSTSATAAEDSNSASEVRSQVQ